MHRFDVIFIAYMNTYHSNPCAGQLDSWRVVCVVILSLLHTRMWYE